MADLLPDRIATKADNSPSRADLDHAARVARVKALDDDLAAVNAGARATITSNNSSGREQLILTNDSPAPAAVVARKIDVKTLHRKAQAVASTLSPAAAELLSLVHHANDRVKSAELIDLPGHVIKSALGVTEAEGLAARAELERAGLIRFEDTFAGRRGFRPKA